MPNSPIGVDISNTHLDVYVVPAGQAARVPNDAAGFKALIAWVEGPVRAVTYEPTGRWHRAFEEALPGPVLVRAGAGRRPPGVRAAVPGAGAGSVPVLTVP